MLTFDTSPGVRRCDGWRRRDLLRLGSLSFFGLSLQQALAAQAESTDAATRDHRSCILLWCAGGISTVDTFDMKPEAPIEYRGEFRPISTSVPGLSVCEHLPKLAQQMHRIGQIRTIVHSGSQHAEANHFMLTGYPQIPDVNAQPAGAVIHPCCGSVVSEQLGWRKALPPFVQLAGSIQYHHAGFLGSALDPLRINSDPNSATFQVPDVSVPEAIGTARLDRRRRMLQAVDAYQRVTERAGGVVADRNEFYQQAFDLITSPAAKEAFRIDQESAALRDRYGRNRAGQSTLLARRLVEAGVRFVTVAFDGYDTHDKNFVRLRDPLLPTLDMAYSTLLEDLADRGLLEQTLVICMGEFGRTPKINGQTGRDHYPLVNSICVSGAGVKMDGHVHGRTNDKCEYVVGAADSTHDLAATIYHLLGVDHTKVYRNIDNRPIFTTDNGRPIRGILA